MRFDAETYRLAAKERRASAHELYEAGHYVECHYLAGLRSTMERLVNKVERLLKSAFKGAAVKLDPVPDSNLYTGYLIWSGFAGVEPLARQSRMWEVLDKGLTDSERHRVATLLTATPAEMAASKEKVA